MVYEILRTFNNPLNVGDETTKAMLKVRLDARLLQEMVSSDESNVSVILWIAVEAN